MILRPLRVATLGVMLCLAVLACGRKGDPIAPEQRLPEPPSRLRLSGEAGKLIVSWTAPRRDRGGDTLHTVAGYRVWRGAWPPGALDPSAACPTCPEELVIAAEIDAEAVQAAGREPTRWVDATAEPGWSYRYQVQAVGRRGRPGPLSAAVNITWAELPTPQLQASPQDRSAVVAFSPAEWPSGVEPFGYRVYTADGTPLAEQTPPADKVTVSGLQNGAEVELFGRLAGRAPEGWVIEGPGTSVRVTPVDRVPPLPPSDLTAFATPEGVQLRWLPAGREPYDALGVLRGDREESMKELAELPGTALGYLDRSVEPGCVYYYTLVSRDAAGNRSLPPRAVRGSCAPGAPSTPTQTPR